MPALSRSTLVALVSAGILLGGCASVRTNALHDTALELGLSSHSVDGAGFSHWVAQAPGRAGEAGDVLRLYIDGDGTPWIRRGRPAIDPTPRNPLVLRLMSLDPGPAVYLGRPCHAGTAASHECNAWDWTHGRYSERIVASMASAANKLVRGHGAEQVILVGYSGGGTLAMLLAPRIPEVIGVATLAGNLDVSAWAEHHGYSPLSGSLDPADEPPLPGQIMQWHLVGADDRRVPADMVHLAVQRQPASAFRILPGVGHVCCWEQHWPALLDEILGDAKRHPSTAGAAGVAR